MGNVNNAQYTTYPENQSVLRSVQICCCNHSRIEYNRAWWLHQMETFSALLAICAGNSPVTGEFPAPRPVTRSFNGVFICSWINGWVNNREGGTSRRHRAHYEVTLMVECFYRAYSIRRGDLSSIIYCSLLYNFCGRNHVQCYLVCYSWLHWSAEQYIYNTPYGRK